MRRFSLYFRLLLTSLAVFCSAVPALSVQPSMLDSYAQLKAFELDGHFAKLEDFRIKRDRIEITLTGTVYFAKPVAGKVCGAVFVGTGRVRSEPVILFERQNIARFLKKETIDQDFTKAVFRFTDDTHALMSSNRDSKIAVPDDVQELASKLEERLVRETGLNLSARLLLAMVGNDTPGFFFAQFDGGDRGRFSALLDHQARVLNSVFGINGGEKGLFFQYKSELTGYDIWTAFYNQQDLQRGTVNYSDAFDLISISRYRMNVDLTDPGNWLRLETQLEISALKSNVQIIPMQLNEGLSEYEGERRKKGLRVLSAQLADGTPVGVIQEVWETGFSLLLPAPLKQEERINVRIKLEGKDSLWSWEGRFHYPRSTETWYPRYGYLSRSLYDTSFRHKENRRVASIGNRVREGPSQANKDEWITEWATNEPLALVTFVIGPFERHEEAADMEGKKIPIEYYSTPGDVQVINEEFLLAEIGNGVRYFNAIFGHYPYERLGAAYFPTRFGQGFPTLLLLPARGYARREEFAFIAHEVSHQWWGNIVGWRSYRDQWLSEGFAEYSGVLYTSLRMKPKEGRELIEDMRKSLLNPPGTDTGITGEKLYEIGPLILGRRLSSRRSAGAYQALIYNKGALILRMLHFLFTDPVTGEGQQFFDMMKDFVNRYRNDSSSTEQFLQTANEHFFRTPIAQKYGIKNLDWFFSQWVWQTALPSYRLEYSIREREDGKALVQGTLFQENAPENWAMPLPVLVKFKGGQIARGTVLASGPKQPVSILLPMKPEELELDPDHWVLSEKTSTKKR